MLRSPSDLPLPNTPLTSPRISPSFTPARTSVLVPSPTSTIGRKMFSLFPRPPSVPPFFAIRTIFTKSHWHRGPERTLRRLKRSPRAPRTRNKSNWPRADQGNSNDLDLVRCRRHGHQRCCGKLCFGEKLRKTTLDPYSIGVT